MFAKDANRVEAGLVIITLLMCVFICHARARLHAFPSAVLLALVDFVIMQSECWLSNTASCKSAGSLTVTPLETVKARAVLRLPEWATIDQTPNMQWSAVVATSTRNSPERPGGSLSSADKLLLTDGPASKRCRPTRLYMLINVWRTVVAVAIQVKSNANEEVGLLPR